VRVLVVTNPRATATSSRERDVLLASLSSVAEVEVAETAHRGHAAALACRAMRAEDTDAVIALGGDGTVNEVVNGLLTDGVHDAVPWLGVVPAGSTNVFARAVGLPNNSIEATGLLLDALRERRTTAVSMGRADDRWFVFGASVGLPAAIVGGVEKQRAKGQRSTHALYARVGVRQFVAAERRQPALSVELPDGTILDRIHFAIVTNTDPWTYAGNRPLRPTPQATFDHGLALYARRRMATPGMLVAIAQISGSKPRVGKRGAYLIHDLESLTIRSQTPVPIEVDGDFLGDRDRLTLRSAAHAIRVLV
jgi:diacylglycerol kinase family enzyme